MFGKKQIQELEAQAQDLQAQLSQARSESAALSQQLEAANRKIEELEARLKDFDLEQAKAEALAMKAEFEGLRDLYKQKNQEFDDSREEKEQSFARDQAMQRHNLENEIRDNRKANQEYVANTVRTFGESYNHYLNQIKVMMEALSRVATQTGETLFAGENADLEARFGNSMQEYLKGGEEALEGDVSDEQPPVPYMGK